MITWSVGLDTILIVQLQDLVLLLPISSLRVLVSSPYYMVIVVERFMLR